MQEVAGPLQVCAGQVGGCEAVIHAMRLTFVNQNVEGALLIDAENAFNYITDMPLSTTFTSFAHLFLVFWLIPIEIL